MIFTALAKKLLKAYDKRSISTIVDMKYEQPEAESDYKKISSREFWDISRWVFAFFFKHEPFYSGLMVVAAVISNLNDLVNAFIFGKMIDKLIRTSANGGAVVSDLYPYIGILVGYNIFNHILNFLSIHYSTSLAWIMRPKTNRAFQERMQFLGIQSLERPDINDKIQRADDSTAQLSAYMEEIVEIVSDVVKIGLTLLLVFKFFPVFIPLVTLLSIPYFLNDRGFRLKNYRFIYDKTPDLRLASMSASDLRSAVKLNEISIIGGYRFLDKKYYEFHLWYERQRIAILKKWRIGNTSSRFLTDIAVYWGFIRIFQDLLNKLITVGETTFRVTMLARLSSTYQNFVNTLNNLMETSVRIRDVYFLFHAKPAFKDGTIDFSKPAKGPEIEIKDVVFKYPNSEKLIFNNLSLRIKSGEKIAIVGHNGAGKTTLVKLLCRIYKPTSGDIVVNGQNLSDLKIETWYQNLGVLFQEFNTYPQLTVRENIAIGNPNDPVDEVALHLAAQSADAAAFIDEFPNKFDQILSEKFKGGVRPSTGQWQKLAIARFFYRNAPLVIFDEPTASIDAVSEYNIFNKIYDFFKDKTVIIISHRFSTVRNADRIIVLDHGEIIEQGTHDFLMSNGGYYARAFGLQAKGYTSNGSSEDY
jgi:ABC-type multidrug transport system fused ATPase/permease subunit